MDGAERQARELREWRAVKEQELAELHEMVEAGQVCEPSPPDDRWLCACVSDPR